MNEFAVQLEELAEEASTHPDRFGDGVRLLFSCGTRDMIRALSVAKALGLNARGVGRMHILIEYEAAVPNLEWVATKGAAIRCYFEQINGRRPQIAIDRGAG